MRCVWRKLSPEERCDFFCGICAGAESGLDFTQDQEDENGRQIGHRLINPALNAMYGEGALTIARAWRAVAQQNPDVAADAEGQAILYEGEAERIQQILRKYNYNPEDKMFGMYDFVKAAQENNVDAGRRKAWSLNGVFALSSGDRSRDRHGSP